jgi:ferredoxin
MKNVIVKFSSQEIVCTQGQLLRDALLENNINPHNGSSKFLNCKGLGTCGTCAVEINDCNEKRNKIEQLRLNIPPFSKGKNLRLACQYILKKDISVKKHKGFWGENLNE